MFSQFSSSLAEYSEIFQDIMYKTEIHVVTAQESAPLKMTGLRKWKAGQNSFEKIISTNRQNITQESSR